MEDKAESVEENSDGCSRGPLEYLREVVERGRGSLSRALSHTARVLQKASSQSSPPGETGGEEYKGYKERRLRKEMTRMLNDNLGDFEMGSSAAESSSRQMSVETTADELGIWRRGAGEGPSRTWLVVHQGYMAWRRFGRRWCDEFPQ
jgi:hypothetical protein